MVLPKRVVEITSEILQMDLRAVETVDSDLLKCLSVPWQIGDSSSLLFWLCLICISEVKITQIV